MIMSASLQKQKQWHIIRGFQQSSDLQLSYFTFLFRLKGQTETKLGLSRWPLITESTK